MPGNLAYMLNYTELQSKIQPKTEKERQHTTTDETCFRC